MRCGPFPRTLPAVKALSAVKSLPAVLVLFMFLLPLAAQDSAQASFKQTLVPKEIYVGDTAQLSYVFQSKIDFYSLARQGGGVSKMEGGILYFDISGGYFRQMEADCTVIQLSMRQVGMTYTIVLDFIPWRPGRLEFIPLDMGKLCHANSDRIITLEPVEVLSLSEKLGASSLRPPASPLLLPGTNYIVWTLIMLSVALLVLFAILAMNFSAALKTAILLKERMGYRRNAAHTKRRLKGLLKAGGTDMNFAQGWQKIMRDYMDYRFSMSFRSVTAKDMYRTVSLATGDMLDIEQENAVLSIQSLFIRTDYIRYAKDSPDSQKLPLQDHEAAFAPEERETLVELSLVDIGELEKEREEFKNYGRI
ncbi:MAG: hypothetical protein K6G18_10880 [Treponema sp.]|nr:hypothetical protein [Treponema sp.]